MPSKLPGPEVGTAEQAEPNGSSAIFALDGAAELVSEELLEPEALLPEARSEPQAERVTAKEALATSRALRLRRVRFTSVVLLQVSVRAQPSWPRRGREVLRPHGDGSGPPRRGAGSGSGVWSTQGVGGSAGDHLDRVPAAGSVREGTGPIGGLELAVRGRRPDGDRVGARRELVRQHPLPPQVGVGFR